MKFKKHLAVLLLLAALLLTSCDVIDQYLQNAYPVSPDESTEEDPNDEEDGSKKPLYKESGTLYSTESEMLVLFADWSAESFDGKTATVRVRVGINCYNISTGKNQLTVKVNGKTQELQTPAIVSQKNQEKTFQFADLNFEVKLTKPYQNLLNISAVWDYNGTYIGQPIEGLTAAAKISFPGGEIIDTDVDTTDTTDSTETDEPPLDPDAPMYSESGRITHTPSKFLTLYADWEAVSEDGKTATVKVSPGIECYALETGAHQLTITVNGESKQYETRAFQRTGKELNVLPFPSRTFEIELEGTSPHVLEISVVWDYGDDDGYNKDVIIEELEASVTVTFPGGEEIPSGSEDNAERINEQDQLSVE